MAKILDGHFKLIHVIELNQFQSFVDQTDTMLTNDITDKDPLYPYLSHELLQIKQSLNRIKPRKIKRSLNFIGSAWKWIAGNPDHNDYEIITNKINDVLENNNRQVIINKLYNERINNITQITNEIKNSLKNDNIVKNKFVLSLQYKMKLIKEELTNIEYAIHWAKIGTINSFILSSAEVALAVDSIDKGNLPYTTVEEALDFAEAKIVTNNSCILYIVSIPITKKEMYEKLSIKAVKRNKYVNQIEFENVIRCKEEIYGIKGNCKTFKTLSICNQDNLVDIVNYTCLPNILRSRPASCKISNNHHISTIDEISEGLILLNQFTGTINISGITHQLNGTFLLKFHNESITIGKKTFIAKEGVTHQTPPAFLQPTLYESNFERILSLPMMEELNINNTRHLEILQKEKVIHQCLTYSTLLVLAIIIVIMILRKKGNCTKVICAIRKQPPSEETPPTIQIRMDQ